MAAANWLLFTVRLIYWSKAATSFCLLRNWPSFYRSNGTYISLSWSPILALSISCAATLFCSVRARSYLTFSSVSLSILVMVS